MGRIRQDLWSDNGPCDEVSKEMCLSLDAPSSTKLDACFLSKGTSLCLRAAKMADAWPIGDARAECVPTESVKLTREVNLVQ